MCHICDLGLRERTMDQGSYVKEIPVHHIYSRFQSTTAYVCTAPFASHARSLKDYHLYRAKIHTLSLPNTLHLIPVARGCMEMGSHSFALCLAIVPLTSSYAGSSFYSIVVSSCLQFTTSLFVWLPLQQLGVSIARSG